MSIILKELNGNGFLIDANSFFMYSTFENECIILFLKISKTY